MLSKNKFSRLGQDKSTSKDKDKNTSKGKDKDKDKDMTILDKINNKWQDEIYSDDSWLKLVELNKIDAIIDDWLNVVWNEIHGENRISSKMIK